MKTFLHYTKEKELDEGFLTDLAREGAKRAGSGLLKAGKFLGKKALTVGRGVAVGVAKGAWEGLKDTSGTARGALGAGVQAGREAYKKGEEILDTTKCKAQAAISSRTSRENREKRQDEIETLQKEISTGHQHFSDRGRVAKVLRRDASGNRNPVALTPEEIDQRKRDLADAHKEHPLLSKLESEEAALKNKKCGVKSTVSRFAGLTGDENYERMK